MIRKTLTKEEANSLFKRGGTLIFLEEKEEDERTKS